MSNSAVGPLHGTVAAVADDILVASEHERLVTSALEHCGVRVGQLDPSEALGLTRIPLPGIRDEKTAKNLEGDLERGLSQSLQSTEQFERRGVEQLIEQLRERLPRTHENPSRASTSDDSVDSNAASPDPAAAPVDTVLRWLRAYFALRYAGWVPTMGKNRQMDRTLGGGGTVIHKAGAASGPPPQATDALEHSLKLPRGDAGRGITVGVLDTAIAAHPWFKERVLARQDDLLPGPSDPSRPRDVAAGHGTFVTGLVLQEAPGATVRVRKILEDDGTAMSWDVAKAIVELGNSGVDILNLALVCYTGDKQPPLALATAIDRLHPGVFVVAASGNHGDPRLQPPGEDLDRREPAWPAALDDVVAVGSARELQPGGEASYELSAVTPPDAAWIDVVVDGQDVHSAFFSGEGYGGGLEDGSTLDFHNFATWTGTSFAAARLSGAVAAKAAKNKVPPREAYRLIMKKAAQGPGGNPPFVDLPRPASWPAAPPAAGDGRA